MNGPRNIAILHVPGWIYIDSIDGRGNFYPGGPGGLPSYPGARIELQKGSHMAKARYYQQGSFRSKEASTVTFEVAGNRSYFMLADVSMRNNQMFVQFEVHPCAGAKAHEINRELKELAAQNAYVEFKPVCPYEAR